jgi:SulP family sulfate permease
MSSDIKQTASTLARHWLRDVLGALERPAEIVRDYRRSDVRPDIMAGLTVAVVLIPQAIAYALIAELPPQTGLYAAVVAAIVGALWGSSAHLHTGPTNAASLLVLSTLLPVAIPGTPQYLAAAGLMAVMVGVARLAMGLARLGVLVNFVSDSVVIGFTAGAGILISVNQLRYFLRVEVRSSPDLYVTLIDTLNRLPQTHWPSLLLGLGTIGVILLLKRFRPQWPSALLGLVAASAAVALFDLDGQGVRVLGELPRSLPPVADLPLLDLSLIRHVSTGALAVAAIGLVEAMSIARSIAAQSGQRLNSNQEFVGQGLANLAAGFFSGYTCSGSFTRSAVNYTAGGRTPMAGVFSGLWVLGAMLLFAPLAAYLPRAALAGVLVLTAYSMVDRREMMRIWHASLGDSAIMAATLLAALLLPLEFAVLTGIIVSFVRYIARTSMPAVYPVVPDANFRHFVRQEEHPACPQLNIMTITGSLYFGASHHVEERVRANLEQCPGQRFLLLRMQFVDHCDVSGIHALETVVRLYRQRKGDVFLTGVHSLVREQMASIGFDRFLGLDHFLEREEAISYLFHKVLDPSVCIYECDVRVFAECQALPKYSYAPHLPDQAALPDHPLKQWLPSRLKAELEQNGAAPGFLLIDVREAREYQGGHIPHAQLLPLRLIPHQGRGLPADHPIVLVCRTGRRSRLAAYILQDLGYDQVYNLQGGMLAWEAAGYPVAVE